MDADLAFSGALEQARMIRCGEVSPTELVDGYLERIERLNPELGAYLTVASDEARLWAKEADARVGDEDLPPFWGVPISIKDLHDTAGIRTTYGTSSWADRVPETDDYVVSRIKAAGFIVLGKTNTPEFGKSVVTEPSGYPPARNPWDPERSPGGSSGGASAALAAGLCPISQASDGGGSTRIPAACCGVFGVKPSRGRVSDAPGFPALTSHPGPVSRTVADAAAFLDVISGYVTGDMFWAARPERAFLEEVGRPPGRLRIAFTTRTPTAGLVVDAATAVAVHDAATLLEDLGHDVEEATPDWPPGILQAGVALRAAGIVSRDDLPSSDDLDELTRIFYLAGKDLSARDYLHALRDLQVACRDVVAFFDRVDILLSPTIAIRPPFVGEFREALSNPTALQRLQAMTTFTMPFNNTGQPAASVPFAHGADGLPIAVQVVARPADEATLFRLSGQLEEARPWRDRRPPLS